jgi:hypothetical protein
MVKKPSSNFLPLAVLQPTKLKFRKMRLRRRPQIPQRKKYT